MIGQLHRDFLYYADADSRHRGIWKSLPKHVAASDSPRWVAQLMRVLRICEILHCRLPSEIICFYCMKILVSFFALASVLPAFGQKEHFPSIKWKERETDHFMLRSFHTDHDPARKLAKRVWKEMSEIIPSLVTDFEKKEFRTPGGADPSKGEQFKYTVYLVADGNTFHEVVQADAKRNNWSIDQVNLTKQVGNYADPHNRFMVICKTDALSSGRGDEQDKSAIFVHIAGSNFLKGQARTGKQPFWMGAGIGYYLEHLVFKKCRVLYLDFDKYYASEDGKAETVKGGTLGPQNAWPPVIRKLCKKDKRVSLQGVMETKITMLTPNESGYIFALTHFMVSNEERLVKYQAFVAAVRDGEEATKELLLESFGYDDDEEFEKEWYDFLESSKFK